jgi:nitroreductase
MTASDDVPTSPELDPGCDADPAMDVFEAMGSARAMRWLKPDPVPMPVIEKVLWAATRATSPNNQQPWDFVVVQDHHTRAEIGRLMKRVRRRPPRADLDPVTRRNIVGATNLITNIASAPVIIFICGTDVSLRGEVKRNYTYSAVYAAAQNLIVAARCLGLGVTFTTLHEHVEPELHELLRIPEDRFLAVTMPLGWPARPFGPVTRKSLEQVVHHETW